MCACRLGTCEINNNRAKVKKPSPNTKKVKKAVARESSSEWSDSESDSCSGCSACYGSSSSCSCSECNMETDSSDGGACYGSRCAPRKKKLVKKKNAGKVLRCRDGVCEWVSKKKVKKPAKAKKPAAKTKKTRNCYDCR